MKSIIVSGMYNKDVDSISHLCGISDVSRCTRGYEVLESLSRSHEGGWVSDCLLWDSSALNLISRAILIRPIYSLLYVRRARSCLSALSAFGRGFWDICPDGDRESISRFLEQNAESISKLVFPRYPYVESKLGLSRRSGFGRRVHVYFLGFQSMMSFSNAMLHVEGGEGLFFHVSYSGSLRVYEMLCREIGQLRAWPLYRDNQWLNGGHSGAVLERAGFEEGFRIKDIYFVLIHGHLSDAEGEFLDRLRASGVSYRVIYTRSLGYVFEGAESQYIDSHELWEMIGYGRLSQ